MKVIKSYLTQFICLFLSLICISFPFIVSFVVHEIAPWYEFIVFIPVGIILIFGMTAKILYNDEKMEMVLKPTPNKVIWINSIKAITYSGLCSSFLIITTDGNIYIPNFFPRWKLKPLFNLIKEKNPSVVIDIKV